jgi:tripartite-type tricarboxylate transporter receptor subunit TctC
LAPPKTPASVIGILNSALVKAAQDPVYKARLIAVGSIPKSSTPQAWSDALDQEARNSEKLVQAGKLKAE